MQGIFFQPEAPRAFAHPSHGLSEPSAAEGGAQVRHQTQELCHSIWATGSDKHNHSPWFWSHSFLLAVVCVYVCSFVECLYMVYVCECLVVSEYEYVDVWCMHTSMRACTCVLCVCICMCMTVIMIPPPGSNLFTRKSSPMKASMRGSLLPSPSLSHLLSTSLKTGVWGMSFWNKFNL